MSDDAGSPGRPAKQYEVGYGRPPRATQFRKGRSGNPSGRPRKGGTLDEIFQAELRAPIVMKENGRQRKIETLHALVKALRHKGIRGDAKALDQLFKRADALEAKAEARRPKISPDASPRLVNRARFSTTLFVQLQVLGVIKCMDGKALLDLSLFNLEDAEFAEGLRSLNEDLAQLVDPYEDYFDSFY